MVHESPAACWFRCVGVAFAVVAERRPANKLAGVIAFVRGLRSANAALHGGVLLAEIGIAWGFAWPSPSEIKFALRHHSPFPLPAEVVGGAGGRGSQ